MKIAVIIIALFGTVLSDKVQLEYEKCERLDMDSTITVTVSKDGGGEVDKGTVVSSQADIAVFSGSCAGTSRTLSVYFNKTMTKLTFTFALDAEDMVSLTTLLQVNSDGLFPGKNYSVPPLAAEGKMELSTQNTSYKCMSEQTISFPQANSSGFIYDVSLMLRDFQAQAFGLPISGFSEATECEQDQASTAEPSTADTTADASTSDGSTTKGPTEETTKPDSTSEATTKPVTSTQGPTTTAGPKAEVNTYEVKEDNVTCIKMVAAITVTVDYETTDNMTKTVNFAVPHNATADGSCGNANDTNATLTIEYESDSIEFMFEDKDKHSMISSVMLVVELDETRFPDAKDAGKMMNMTSKTQIGETDDVKFYTCIAGNDVKFDSGMLDITQLKVQAFNLKNGNFSDKGTDCPADATTTASPSPASSTTPKPKPAGPPVNNFRVRNDNGTCLMMNASLVLEIHYKDKVGNKLVVHVEIPENVTYDGTCGETVETLMIKPFPDWSIEMTFSGASAVEANELAADDKYQLTNLTVTYKFDDHMPKANMSGKVATVSKTVNQFDAPVDGSYKCNANVSITLSDDLSLQTSHFRYQAFQDNSTTFNDKDLQECNADIETNSIVPIAVGAALAGLVVIVLIAYLIGRRKSRRQGYESV